MTGLPVRKDGRLHSGRVASRMLASALETIDGRLSARAIDDAMVRNEVETLAKQRDVAYALAHSSLEVARRMIKAVESVLPVFEEADVDIEVRYERAREALTELVKTFQDSGLDSADTDAMLTAMDDPWHTRQAEPEEATTTATAGTVIEDAEGQGTSVCRNCQELIRRYSSDDAWFHVVTGGLSCE